MLLLNSSLFAATLILSLKTGIILGTSWLSLRAVIFNATLLGGGLFFLTQFFIQRQGLLIQLLDKYTFTGALLMAGLLIYLGLEQPETKGNRTKAAGGRLTYLLSFLPCPFCMAALAFSIIIMAPLMGTTTITLGRNVTVVFVMLVIATALAIRKMIKFTKYQPVIIFNQILFFLGLATLIFALFVPNLVKAMNTPFHPLEISSPELLGLTVIGVLGFSLLGYFYYIQKAGDN